MSKPIKSFYEATKYLGQFIGSEVPFLLDTSCMSPERRKQIAVLTWIMDISEKEFDKMTDSELLNQILKPLLEKLGFAEWVRDTVTDMAIRRGLKGEIEYWNVEENLENNKNATNTQQT